MSGLFIETHENPDEAPSDGANMLDINDSSIIQQDRIGYIPENVNLYPYLTGVENLDYFSKLAGLKFTLEELARFLLECGLEKDAFNKSISEYSKGMRQKVGIFKMLIILK